MHSITTIELTAFAADAPEGAANDSTTGPDYTFADVELLVATTVARVTARVQPEFVNVVLDLSAHDAIVAGNPTTLAFALAGILGALLRAADENGDDEVLRIVVTEHGRHVRVSIAGPDVPPLCMLRALADSPSTALADPTVAHCRRIVEHLGGTLGLGSSDGELAVELCLPAYPQGKDIRVLTPRSLRPAKPAAAPRPMFATLAS
jgi:hypothetical protein